MLVVVQNSMYSIISVGINFYIQVRALNLNVLYFKVHWKIIEILKNINRMLIFRATQAA